MADYRISIIDDSFDDCLALTRRLSQIDGHHYHTTLIHDVETGFDAITEQHADLYFIDLDLDGHNGLDLLRRAQFANNRKPIVVVTGNENPIIDMQALELGATDFINKNELSPLMLNRTIRHAITRKAHELRLQHAATHDALTELAQKHHFQAELDRAISRHLRSGNSFGLLLLDLDQFKPVNDEHGHRAGDELLKRVAEALQRSVRNGDLVGRLGGDEFGVLLESVTADDLATIRNVISRRVQHPMSWRNTKVQVGCSIGAAVYPSDAKSAQALLEIADHRMYAEKGTKTDRLVSQR